MKVTNNLLQCRLCLKTTDRFFNLPRRPIINQLLEENQQEPKYFDMTVYWCEACQFLQLKHIIPPDEFYNSYATPSAWKTEPHIGTVIEKLLNNSDGKTPVESIIEIGCNDGKLLNQISELGISKLLGVEPSWNSLQRMTNTIDIIPDYFTESLAVNILKEFGTFQTIVTRHVLEHIDDIHGFVKGLRRISKEGTRLFVEVPDVITFYEETDFAFWEEHLNYFSTKNLVDIFANHGFTFILKNSFLFSGKAQLLEFTYTGRDVGVKQRWSKEVHGSFVFEELERQINIAAVSIRKLTQFVQGQGGRVFVWGIGNRSIGTLYALNAIDCVDFFVDENTNKVGKLVPGTKKLIYDPDLLKKEIRNSDLILLGVNSENETRVINKLSSYNSQILSLLAPSEILWNKI